MAELSLKFLGSPVVEVHGQGVHTDRRKALALLAYLAVTGHPARREKLAALFWPDYEAERAFSYLRRALWEANQMIGGGYLNAGRDEIQLVRHPGLAVDALEFERLLDQAKASEDEAEPHLDAAAHLWRGDFLAGFSLRDSPEFDEWQVNLAEYYRRRLGEALQQLVKIRLAKGQPRQAQEPAARWAELDPFNEAAHRLLMEVYARGGQRSAALRQYERCAALLNGEFGAVPAEETRALYEQIRSGAYQPAAAGREEFSAPTAGEPARFSHHRLPVPGSPFIGRKAELAEIGFLLAKADCRLVTLYGPGGMGKTRLALEAARDQTAQFPDGICFISLAALTNPDQVPAAAAAGLGITLNEKMQSSGPKRQVIDYLRNRRVLLVMDNFEHLVQAGGFLAELLAEAPQVKIIATSRERLNLGEEWVFELAGMSFPLESGRADPELYSSVQLFLHHAQRAQNQFRPKEEDLRQVGRICSLLEGLPLGIVLAAAWVRMLSCAEIAAEIEQNLDFLATDQQDIPSRHRSLRVVFDHTWQSLNPEERRGFRQLSIFKGGFTKEAAKAVAGVGLAQLAAMVDKSLVYRRPDGRYNLHEVLNQYAAEKLAANPLEQNEIREIHRAYYLDLLIHSTDELVGANQKNALQRLSVESANVRAAWYRTVAQGSLDELERITPRLMEVFILRSRHQEGLETFRPALDRLRREQAAAAGSPQVKALLTLLLAIVGTFLISLEQEEGWEMAKQAADQALSLPPGILKAYAAILLFFGNNRYPADVAEDWFNETLDIFANSRDPMGQALAMNAYGGFLQGQLQMGRSREMFTSAHAVYTRLGNRWGIALCSQDLANIAYWTGGYTEACRLAREGIAIYEDLDDPWRKMEMNIILGQSLTALGDYSAARDCFRDALEFTDHMGNLFLTAVNLDCLAFLGYLEGEFSEAEAINMRALSIYRQIQHPHGTGMSLANLGDDALGRGDLAGARKYYLEGLEILAGLSLPWGKSKCLKMLGWVDLLEGDLARADENLKAALKLSAGIERQADELETLELRAELHARRGQPARSLAILTALLAHPALTAEVRRRARALELSLVDQLTGSQAETARAEGRERSLDAWISEETI